MIKVIAISGSLRKGNTEALTNAFLAGCKAIKGVKVKNIKLRILKPRFDCGNDKCWHTEKCKIKDSLTCLLNEIKTTDLLVLASPNYFNSVSALFKIFIERTNPFGKFKCFNGIKAILIVVGGNSKKSNLKVLSYLKEFARIHRLKVVNEINVVAEKKDDVLKNKKLIEKIKKKGKKIALKIKKEKLGFSFH